MNSRGDRHDSTPPEPTDEDLRATDAFAARFEAIHGAGTEFLELQGRAARARAGGRHTAPEGLAPLLDELLPTDAAAEGRIARAVGIGRATLEGLRAGALDPLSVPALALAILGRALGLDLAALEDLVTRDRARLGMGALAGARDAAAGEGFAAVRDAWAREEEDDA